MPMKIAATTTLAIAATTAHFVTEESEAARTLVHPAAYLIETTEPLAPADVMFGRSLHVTQTDSFARDGKHYLAMRAPTRSALDAFLQGTGRATSLVAR